MQSFTLGNGGDWPNSPSPILDLQMPLTPDAMNSALNTSFSGSPANPNLFGLPGTFMGTYNPMLIQNLQHEISKLTADVNKLRAENENLQGQLKSKDLAYQQLLDRLDKAVNNAACAPANGALTSFPSVPAPAAVDLSKIRFRTRKQWLDSPEYEALKQGSNNANHGATAIARDNRNSRMQFIEDIDGNSVDGTRAAAGRALARALFVQMELAGVAPAKWTAGPANVRQAFYHQLATLFPEIGYCDDSWKAEYLASRIYSNWYRDRKKSVQRMKEEDLFDLPLEDEEDGKKRKSPSPSRDSSVGIKNNDNGGPQGTAAVELPTAKRQRLSSSSDSEPAGLASSAEPITSSTPSTPKQDTSNLDISPGQEDDTNPADIPDVITTMFNRPRPRGNVETGNNREKEDAQNDTPANMGSPSEDTTTDNSPMPTASGADGPEATSCAEDGVASPVSPTSQPGQAKKAAGVKAREWNPTNTGTARSLCAVDWKEKNPNGSTAQFKGYWDEIKDADVGKEWKKKASNAATAKKSAANAGVGATTVGA
ncbi:hypothetical protein VNI00_019039 [Paramarasmius palmivorus]|uniref:Uncharacterized protein n=1 Tax=Paramarasmius palmivorus TaxID=297713 RepID=A0AAW0AUV2_9AGAR